MSSDRAVRCFCDNRSESSEQQSTERFNRHLKHRPRKELRFERGVDSLATNCSKHVESCALQNEWPLYRVSKVDGRFKTTAYSLSDSTVSASLDDASEEERRECRSLADALSNVSMDVDDESLLGSNNAALSSTVYRWLMMTRVLCMTK